MADSSPIIKVDSIQTWDLALQEIKGYGVCGLHIENIGSDPLTSRIRSVQLAVPNGRVYLADIFNPVKEIFDDLAVLLEDSQVKKVIYDAKVALSFVRASQGHRLKFKNIFDVMLASQLCWSGYYDLVPSKSAKNPWKKRIPDHSLEALAERHLGIILDRSSRISDWEALEPTTEQVTSAAKYAEVLLPLHAVLQELLIKNTLMRVAELEFRTISPVVEMELSGINLDADAARALMQEKEDTMVEAFLELQAEAKKNGFVPIPREGRERSKYLNPDSQEDVKRYLQSRCFNITSTRAEVLKELAMGGNIFADRLLSYRQISHQLAFLNSWLQDIHPLDGRIHPKYFQLKSETGRLSSRKPNAQQVPKRGEDGMAIRRLFKASPGKKLVKVDFSCIELRIMAFLSGDETMIKAFQAGQDIHRLTASMITGQPLDQVTRDQRQAAKIINFLLIYGGSAETLQQHAICDYGLAMSLDEAREYQQKYFEIYSGVKEWQHRQVEAMNYTHQHWFHDCVRGTFYLALTCTFTALGRRRVWPRFGVGIKASKFQAFNTPSQGTGADILKMVMCELYDGLDSEDVKIIASIHDELLLEVPEDRAEEYAKMLSEIMNRIGSKVLYPVPVTSEADILSSWGG